MLGVEFAVDLRPQACSVPSALRSESSCYSVRAYRPSRCVTWKLRASDERETKRGNAPSLRFNQSDVQDGSPCNSHEHMLTSDNIR